MTTNVSSADELSKAKAIRSNSTLDCMSTDETDFEASTCSLRPMLNDFRQKGQTFGTMPQMHLSTLSDRYINGP